MKNDHAIGDTTTSVKTDGTSSLNESREFHRKLVKVAGACALGLPFAYILGFGAVVYWPPASIGTPAGVAMLTAFLGSMVPLTVALGGLVKTYMADSQETRRARLAERTHDHQSRLASDNHNHDTTLALIDRAINPDLGNEAKASVFRFLASQTSHSDLKTWASTELELVAAVVAKDAKLHLENVAELRRVNAPASDVAEAKASAELAKAVQARFTARAGLARTISNMEEIGDLFTTLAEASQGTVDFSFRTDGRYYGLVTTPAKRRFTVHLEDGKISKYDDITNETQVLETADGWLLDLKWEAAAWIRVLRDDAKT